MENPGIERWEKIVENTENMFFDMFHITQNYIAIIEKENMQTRIRVIDKKGKTINIIKFSKEESYTVKFKHKENLPANTFQYTYSSMATPKKTFEYDIDKKQTTFIKQNLPVGFDAKKYKTKLIWASSKDGTKVPVSLVYNKKLVKKNGKSPVLLYAYGSYGASQDPSFSSTRLSLLDRGFVYAIAHIRGGSELGKKWQEDAMLLKKKNTFYDYIACAEQLIKEKYTSEGKIVARGGSAGGLTMGAVVNMRPGLFNTVILEAPYLDVLSTLSDTTAKFCLLERISLGDPTKPEVFDYIKSYSPYQNIKKQKYPNMLFSAGLLDTRVEYWNALKSVAKLRALKTDKNNLLLKMDLYAGHNSYQGRYSEAFYESFVFAFILNNLRIKY
jgi:oligopeptidase B